MNFFLANEFDSSRLKACTEAMNVYTSIIKFVGVELSSSTINKNRKKTKQTKKRKNKKKKRTKKQK